MSGNTPAQEPLSPSEEPDRPKDIIYAIRKVAFNSSANGPDAASCLAPRNIDAYVNVLYDRR